MAHLRGADLTAILGFLEDVDDLDLERPTAPDALGLLARLVGADAVVYDHLDRDGFARIDHSEFDASGLEGPGDDVYLALQDECPFHAHRTRTGIPDAHATRMCDLISDRALHRLAIYREYLHPWGTESAIELPLPAPVGQHRLLFFSSSVHRFTVRDGSVLDALRPHLVRLERNRTYRRHAMEDFGEGGASSQDVPSLGLTKREAEILELVAAGCTNAQIARQLWVSPGTVRTHLEHIFAKLDVSNRTSAAARLHARTGIS